jgi:hypothetical protein
MRSRVGDLIKTVIVVVPARLEEQRIADALHSIAAAKADPALTDVEVQTVVAVDRNGDRTDEIARGCGATIVVGQFGCPGRARQAGVERARCTSQRDRDAVWVATTDADCVVPSDWLASHVARAAAGADAVVGGIRIGDWAEMPDARHAYEALLRTRRHPDGTHSGMYGANLGVRLSSLDSVGGFPSVPVGEDRAVVAALESAGYVIDRTERPSVSTSARRDGRADGGLSSLLRTLAASGAHADTSNAVP